MWSPKRKMWRPRLKNVESKITFYFKKSVMLSLNSSHSIHFLHSTSFQITVLKSDKSSSWLWHCNIYYIRRIFCNISHMLISVDYKRIIIILVVFVSKPQLDCMHCYTHDTGYRNQTTRIVFWPACRTEGPTLHCSFIGLVFDKSLSEAHPLQLQLCKLSILQLPLLTFWPWRLNIL